MTQYCWNSKYTGADPPTPPTSSYNGNYCVPSTTLDGGQYTYPQALPLCLLALSDCTDDPSEDTLELPEDVADCTRWNVQEIGYLGEHFYSLDDFEVYHSDLDNESVETQDKQTVATPGSSSLLGVNTTLSEVAGGSSVPEPWASFLQDEQPCPKVETP